MIIEEGSVITLEGDERYFLADEIGEIDEYPGSTFYFGTGVTKENKLNSNEICFIEIEKDDKGYFATKVENGTKKYDILTTLETLSLTAISHPELKDKITKELEKE